MSIHNYLQKIKGDRGFEDIGLVLLVILVGMASFGLGRLSVSSNKEDSTQNNVIITNDTYFDTGQEKESIASEETKNGFYVASRNGTKYYKYDCSGAERIGEENKIWFETSEEAELAGYEVSSTCDYK